MHKQRTHKCWYDSQLQGITPKKARWSIEKIEMMAKHEICLLTEHVTSINKFLFPLTPGRTLEAIKGQRRSNQYKDIIERLKRDNDISLCSSASIITNSTQFYTDKVLQELTNIQNSNLSVT
ncbi:MAG: hypothetical protein PV362_17975 [Providencia heimbachae]|nr:hypothetical protein [Providencia heimbachae]